MQSGHDRVLAQIVLDVLADANAKIEQLERFAVATGPGSFTGARIGVAFARGLAIDGPAPVVGINLLEVLARCAVKAGAQIGVGMKQVGRGQIAWCAADADHVVQAPQSGDPADFIPALDMLAKGKRTRIFGDPVDEIARQISVQTTNMDNFAALARKVDPAKYLPNPWYARPPDAKLPGGIDPWA